MADDQQRDRVRALVRDVLKTALPDADPLEETNQNAPFAPESRQSGARIFNIAPQDNQQAPESPAHDESTKSIITEDDVRALEHGARLLVAENVRFTSLASDIVRERNINVEKKRRRRSSGPGRVVAVGADHGGFEFKEDLKLFLAELGHQVRDHGTNSRDAVDYPDFAHAVARSVADHAADVGIIIDGAGIGSAMTANKVPGVRAAACYSVALAKNSREHNGANVLTLGSGQMDKAQMREIVKAWLETDITEDRHRKRVAKIDEIARRYNK
jgi:ribose 5-phosphate isomerase B